MTRLETPCLKDMLEGILKSRSVCVNQIAASLREPLKLKDVAKRLLAQYLKEGYADKVRDSHLGSVAPGVSKENFIVMDGTEISKNHDKCMEGLDFVKNGNTGGIGPGYNVLNINVVNAHKEIIPLIGRAHSFGMGGLSGNNEIKKAVWEEQYEKRADGYEGQDPSAKKIRHGNDKRPAQEHLPGRTFAPPQLWKLHNEPCGEPYRILFSRKKTGHKI